MADEARAEIGRSGLRRLIQSGLAAALLFDFGCGAKSLSPAEPLAAPNPDVVRTCESSGADWCAELTSGKRDVVSAIVVDTQGNVVVTGYTTGNLTGNASQHGASEVFIAKYTPDGVLIWLREFGTDEIGYAEGIAADSHDDIFIVGVRSGEDPTQYGFLAKLSAQGDRLWTRQSGERSGSVALDPSGNVLWAGGAFGDGATLEKYSSAGDLLWKQTLGAEDGNVTCDSAGNILLSGSNAADTSGWLQKFATSGERLWRIEGNVGFFLARFDNSSGDFFVLGNDNRWLLRRYTGLGDLVWSEYEDMNLYDETGIAIGPGGDLFVLGMSSDSKMGGYDSYVAKFSADGERIAGKALGIQGSFENSQLALGPNGEVFVGGPLLSSGFLLRLSL